MPTIFLRAFILYALLMLTMRAMGKRQLGQLQPYEFVMAMLIANLIATPMSDVSTPLLHGLLPVAALYVAHSLITLVSMRSDRVRALISGKPVLVVSKGVVQREELRKLCLTLADLLEGLRKQGILDPSEVGTAIMEADGTITAFPLGNRRPPVCEEAGVDPGYEGLPMVLVMDGRLQPFNLSQTGRDGEWLNAQLDARGQSVESVLLAVLDTQGRLTVQSKSGEMYRFQAMDASEVRW